MPSININHVVLTGRLTSDPDCAPCRRAAASVICGSRSTPGGATRTGEWGEKPNFFNVVVFGAPGENVARYMHKGRAVAVDGRLDWREWETPDGRNAQAVSVIANTVQFLDSPPSGGGGTPARARACCTASPEARRSAGHRGPGRDRGGRRGGLAAVGRRLTAHQDATSGQGVSGDLRSLDSSRSGRRFTPIPA